MKLLTIVGARPQFIKAGILSQEIAKRDDIEEIILHTGQHYDKNMSDIFFEEMKIPKPNYFLGISGKSHGAMTGQMMEEIERVALKEKPDYILIYGDTNSTLAGALVGSKLHIPVAHIEAGLRSFNMKMPEEVNRVLSDRVSKLLFCPTDRAIENLKAEGFDNFDCRVIKSGDIMQDVALFYRDFAKKPDIEIDGDFILATLHRAENTDNSKRLIEIFEALDEIAKEVNIILPLHPRTKKRLEELNYNPKNIKLIKPVSYLEMVWLLNNSKMVITDSGGLQKEAFFFKKPCITVRDETEWVELLEHKFNILVGADRERILKAFREFKFNSNFDINLYGGGKAREVILRELING